MIISIVGWLKYIKVSEDDSDIHLSKIKGYYSNKLIFYHYYNSLLNNKIRFFVVVWVGLIFFKNSNEWWILVDMKTVR